MATIVCLERTEVKEIRSTVFKIYDVVDGQQRVTTLVALLKAISIELAKGSEEECEEAKELNKLIVKGEDNDLILLQTNHAEAEIFRGYLRSGIIPVKGSVKTLAEKNLYTLFKDCEKFVKHWKAKIHTLIRLLYVVKNQLEFILHQIDDEAVVYTVFEVLNSRGLEVNWLDKSKSVLMGIVYEKFGNQHNTAEYVSRLKYYWSEIYKMLGIKEIDGDEILNFTATLMLPDKEKGKLLSSQSSVDLFKELSYLDIENTLEIAKNLLDVTKRYKELSDNRYLRFFSSISQARYLYVSIMTNERLNETDKQDVLVYWEKITFRIYGMMDRDVKKRVGDYIKLGREIFQYKMKNPFNSRTNPQDYTAFELLGFKNKIIFKIEQIGKEAPVEKAAEFLRCKNCYTSWQDELRYFFYKYEMYIAKMRNSTVREEIWTNIFSSTTESIEHIIPQNDPFCNWSEVIADIDLDENVNRIGNLLIIPPHLNSRAATSNFSTKKQVYKDALLHIANDVVFNDYILEGDREERREWSLKSIEQREDDLINVAIEIWRTDS